MTYSFRMIGRTVLWYCRKTAGTIVLVSMIVFLLLYGCAWQSGQLSQLFTVSLGGFKQSVLLALFWLAVHLPAEGFVYGWMMNQANKSYCIRLLKYESKFRYLGFMITFAIILLILYYVSGYGILLILCKGNEIGLALWQMSLAILESLSIVLTAAAISFLYPKLENIAFSAVITAELASCTLCCTSEKLRILPFTYGKLVLQKDFFDNGIALAASILTIGILLVLTTMMWLRKDERSGAH